MQSAGRFLLLGIFVMAGSAGAQTSLPLKRAPQRTQPAITTTDLMTRLYLYADDSMMGRSAGTEYNLKATAYIAAEVKRLGLMPAGDSGGYFQSVPLISRTFAPQSHLAVNGTDLRPWEDYLPRDQGVPTRSLEGVQAVFAGAWGDSVMLAPDQAAGKLVVIAMSRRPSPQQPAWFVPRAGATARFRNAAGIAVVSLDSMPPQLQQLFRSSQVAMKDVATPAGDTIPTYLYLTRAAAIQVIGTSVDSAAVGSGNKTIQGSLDFVETVAPARNVVAMLPGSDPELRSQFVAIGAHNDHVGFNSAPADHDSIHAYNAAVRRLELAAPNHQVTPEQLAQIRVNVDSLRKLRPARRDSKMATSRPRVAAHATLRSSLRSPVRDVMFVAEARS